jgi:EmrB/QacA subfamily drug resistance transporter
MPRLPLLVTSLAVFAVFLDTTVLFVAFPDIVASFPDVAPAQLSWVLNAYTIVFAALLVPFGKLADRVGHKRLFLSGSALFTVASLLCGLAPAAWALVAFRVVQAAAAAALLPSSLALVLKATPRAQVPVALAIWGATGAVAGAIGPSLGSVLIEAGGWRWVFLLNLPVGALIVIAGIRFLAESIDRDTVLPAPGGVLLLIAGSVLLTLGLVRGADWGWTAPQTGLALVSGVAVLALLMQHQLHSSRPAVDLALFSSPNFNWAVVAGGVYGAAFSAMFLSSVLFLTDVWQYSIVEAGLGISPGPALVAVLAPAMGRLAARVGQRPLLVGGGLVYALAGVWRLLLFDAEPSYVATYLPSMLISGIGVALCIPQLSSVVGQALPPGLLGVGSGVSQAARQLGATAGVALTIAFVSGATSVEAALDRFDRAWWLIVAGGLATSLLCLPLRTGSRDLGPEPVLPLLAGPVPAPMPGPGSLASPAPVAD